MSEYVNARINAPPEKVLSDKEDFQQRGRVLCDKGGFCANDFVERSQKESDIPRESNALLKGKYLMKISDYYGLW